MDNQKINTNLPVPTSMGYEEIINSIENGIVQIPKFQRDFVWTLDKTAKLLDSILKGYPIGTFILWETSEGITTVKELGGKTFQRPENKKSKYILDGQQRITSIFVAHSGESVTKPNSKSALHFNNIYVDLSADIDDDEAQVITDKRPDADHRYIRFTEMLNYAGEEFSDKLVEKIKQYKEIFYAYKFSVVTLNKDDVGSAIEVFTRLNTGGKPLTLFDIVSAKTYDEKRGFDLQKEWGDFIEELKSIQYGDLSNILILKILAVILDEHKECKRQTIMRLSKNDIISNFPDAIETIRESIDYFKKHFGIPISVLLPYDSLLVPFSYFFFKVKKHNIQVSNKHHLYMQEFFWRASLSSRYSGSTDSKLGKDIRRISTILEGKRPSYSIDDFNILYEANDIINIDFNIGKGYCKAILCLLSSKQPRDFENNGEVILDRSLKSSNKKNCHHFFPRAYLKKQGIDNENSLANITLISNVDNLKIKDTPPSEYIEKFKVANQRLSQTLESHFIGDIKEFGINENNYRLFLRMRATRISEELKKLINPDLTGLE